MINLFRKLFLIKEIKSRSGDLHFQRWRIFSCKFFSIYIHKIYKADEDKHLHNHPWNYFNLILFGGYEEESKRYGNSEFRNMIPFRYSFRRHDTYHKISILFKPTTTLFLTGQRKFQWGYDVEGNFVDNEKYRDNKNLGLYGKSK